MAGEKRSRAEHGASLPLCGVSLVALMVFLPSKPTEGNIRAKLAAIDYGGCIASLVATVLLLMGLTWGGITFPWQSAAGRFNLITSDISY